MKNSVEKLISQLLLLAAIKFTHSLNPYCKSQEAPYFDITDDTIKYGCCQYGYTYYDSDTFYKVYMTLTVPDSKYGLRLSKDTLAQEGKSFCLVAEHIKGTKLSESKVLERFEDLWMHDFDIGNHIRPDDSTKMNRLEKRTFGAVYENQETHFGRQGGGEPIKPSDFQLSMNRPAYYPNQPDADCVNPYKIEVTEIYAHKTRLHNYLHIKVYADAVTQSTDPDKNCPTGKMKYLMLEVRDSVGLPVGHFTHEVPCDQDKHEPIRPGPNGIQGIKYVGGRDNHMPCMFAPKKAVSHPGIFLATTAEKPDPSASSGSGGGATTTKGPEYFTEVHATWRFAQMPSNFIQELHFAALIVEDPTPIRYFTSRRHMWKGSVTCQSRSRYDCQCYRQETFHYAGKPSETKCVEYRSCGFWNFPNFPSHGKYWAFFLSDEKNNLRPYGYIAQYSKLTLSEETMGGWDYYRKDFIVPKYVDCHVKPSRRYYSPDPKNSKLTTWLDILNGTYNQNQPDNYYIWNPMHFVKDSGSGNPNQVSFDQVFNYSAYDPLKLTTKYSRVTDLSKPLAYEEGLESQPLTTYFGTKYTDKAYEPSRPEYGPTYEQTINPGIKGSLNKLNNLNDYLKSERCPCPLLPTTVPPERATKKPLELEGRRLHAIQMFTAWVILIPIGIFVSRYYKETYAKVFFMQEYWFYTVHIMCLITAFVFMCGGVYVVRYNRVSNTPWPNETYIHVIFGYLIMIAFGLHLVLGPFRLWTLYWRMVQIMMHWTFGVVEYFLGVATIYYASLIVQGYMNCNLFYIYFACWVTQFLFFVGMDIHLRYVDHVLGLKPPRTYLPPPVKRLYHDDAPFVKFRMSMLFVFSVISIGFYVAIHFALSEENGEISCYQHEVVQVAELEL